MTLKHSRRSRDCWWMASLPKLDGRMASATSSFPIVNKKLPSAAFPLAKQAPPHWSVSGPTSVVWTGSTLKKSTRRPSRWWISSVSAPDTKPPSWSRLWWWILSEAGVQASISSMSKLAILSLGHHKGQTLGPRCRPSPTENMETWNAQRPNGSIWRKNTPQEKWRSGPDLYIYLCVLWISQDFPA